MGYARPLTHSIRGVACVSQVLPVLLGQHALTRYGNVFSQVLPVLRGQHALTRYGNMFSQVLPVLLGRRRYDAGLTGLLDSLSHQAINRHLLLHFLDLTLSRLVPDLDVLVSRGSAS